MAELEQEFLDVFIEEVEDIISRLEVDLIDLEKNKHNQDLINKVFRSFHTIKGSGGLVGFNDLSNYTHHIEALLEKIRNGQEEVTPPSMEKFLTAVDKTKGYINLIKKGEVPSPSFFADNKGDNTKGSQKETQPAKKSITKKKKVSDSVQEEETKSQKAEQKEEKILVQNFKEPLEETQQEKSSFTKEEPHFFYKVSLNFQEDFFKTGNNPLLLLKEMDSLGVLDWVALNSSFLPSFKDMDFALFYLKWDILYKTNLSQEGVEDIFLFVMDNNQVQIKVLEEEEYQELLQDYYDKSENENLGTIELQDGKISNQELEAALNKNEELGELLLKSGYIDQSVLDRALAKRSGTPRNQKERSFIRVNTDKLDMLLNLVSELIISHSRIYSIVHRLSVHSDNTMEINNVITGLENLTRDIQEQVMSIRMIPLGPTFVQFNRLVRDLAQKQNKKIDFQILGSETELDKNMIEKISDPLKHMVRNAIDHGLETSEKRKQRGKPEEGHLFLEAYYKEGNVVIEIRDDGNGIDKTKVLAKALEKGLVGDDENLTEQQIFQLIFAPGFSTAQEVSDISGRGVGMDVVRQNIDNLRGKIEIFSTTGKGTTFRILLPLTMAIIDGMLVCVSQSYYVVPLLSIVESFKPEKDLISSVEGNVEVIEYRDEYIPLIRLSEALYQSKHKKPLTDSILVIVESNGKKYGFQADELIGQQQIVVKSLDTNYQNVGGLSGATILGDGKVALILDIEGIVKNVMQQKEHAL